MQALLLPSVAAAGALDDEVWVSVVWESDVYKIDRSSGAITTVPAGDGVITGSAMDESSVWFTNPVTQKIFRFDKATNAVTTISVSADPQCIALDRDFAWVSANSGGGGAVLKIDKATNAVVATYGGMTGDMQEIAVDADYAWAASFMGHVWRVHKASGAVDGFAVGGNPAGIATDGVHVWATHYSVPEYGAGSVRKLDRLTGAVLTTIPVGYNAQGLAVDGEFVWSAARTAAGAGTLAKISKSTDSVESTYTVSGHWTSGCVVDSDAVWVSTEFAAVKVRKTDGAILLSIDLPRYPVWNADATGFEYDMLFGVPTPPNAPPVADAGLTVSSVISANGADAPVLLNGTASSDPDGDALTFSWTVDGAPAGSGPVVATTLSVGTHTVVLTVFDGTDADTDTRLVTVESAASASSDLADLVETLGLPTSVQNPLTSKLQSAADSFASGNTNAGVNKLQAFQNQVQAKTGKSIDAATAAMLQALAQEIIDSQT